MDRRTSIAGIALIIIGAGLLLSRLDVIRLSMGDALWVLAVAGGGAMLYRGFTGPTPPSGKIFWGTVFLAVGALQLADRWMPMGIDPGIEGPLYLAVPGVAWMLVVAKSPREWHVLIPAVALLGLALAMYMTEIGTLTRGEVMDTVGRYWPVALVAFGFAVILTGWRKSQPS
jgi:hypothetical protein